MVEVTKQQLLAQRNSDMREMYKQNKVKWSAVRLGIYFNLTRQAVHAILKTPC